jgi:hypothetical protein
MVVAEHDHTAATDLALKAYERALEPKRLVMTDRVPTVRPVSR